ncbi:MAG: hypothetical protein EOP05_06975 [Proteobacteria bacterium]|nr:MAG: hypothetical protein EOP05_06975 [Pseudomonadota bacterium]
MIIFKVVGALLSASFIFSGTYANAAPVDCKNIRTCSEYSHVYELAASACRAQFQQFNCGGYKSDKELGSLLRSCTPEALCSERQDWAQARGFIPGCTGVTQAKASQALTSIGACAKSFDCMKQVPAETLRNLGRMAVGLATHAWTQVKTVYALITNTKETWSDVERGAFEYNRRYQCLNNQYKYKVACEIAGGAFAAATVGGSLTKASGSALRGGVAPSVARVTGRESVLAATGRGVSKSKMADLRRAVRTGGVAGVVANSGTSASREQASARAVTKPVGTSTKAVGATRDEYLKRLIGRQNTTVEQRRAFAELAYRTESDGKTMFLDLQNSKMKYLNDHLGNKNVVTAVTNHRLELTFESLKDLKTKYPGLENISYDDFKSGRMAFRFADGKVPAGFQKDVSALMAKADEDYIAELGRIGILPEGSDILPADKWFAAGTGRTGDQANAASRYAARTDQQTVDFWNPIVRKNLEGRLNQTNTYRAGVMNVFKNSPALSERLPNGEFIPTTEVFEAYRKTTDASSFAKLITEKTGEKVSTQSAQNLRQYLSMLDEWSTGLLIVEPRQAVSFAGSKFNGATIDISGMGALNMQELAKSLVGVKDIDNALVRARQSERSATVIFERNKQAIVQAAEESLKRDGIEAQIRVSGDDIIVLPTNKELSSASLARMHEAIATSSSSSNVRISAVAKGVGKADQVAVFGETVEKHVRGLTLGAVKNQANYTLMVVSDATGLPQLKVAARNGAVSPEVEEAFQSAFRQSLQSQEP